MKRMILTLFLFLSFNASASIKGMWYLPFMGDPASRYYPETIFEINERSIKTISKNPGADKIEILEFELIKYADDLFMTGKMISGTKCKAEPTKADVSKGFLTKVINNQLIIDGPFMLKLNRASNEQIAKFEEMEEGCELSAIQTSSDTNSTVTPSK